MGEEFLKKHSLLGRRRRDRKKERLRLVVRKRNGVLSELYTHST